MADAAISTATGMEQTHEIIQEQLVLRALRHTLLLALRMILTTPESVKLCTSATVVADLVQTMRDHLNFKMMKTDATLKM